MTDHTSTDCNCRFCSFSHLHQLLGLFFSPLLLLFKHTQAASTSSTLQVLIVSMCFCVYTVCHYLVMKKLQLWPPRVTVLEMRPFSRILFFLYIYTHANTHRVRTVCRFATNSSPFLKLFFWVVKLGLQLTVGWLSRHKLKRMNDYSYVFKIITGVFIKGFWMQLNFISVISTHKFFPSPSISCHIPDEQACCFQTISKTSSCHLKCVYWQDP